MKKNTKILLINILIYLVFVTGTAFLYESAVYSNLLAIALLAVSFFFFHDLKDCIYFIVGLLLTTSTEILAVKFGIWKYAYPHLFGIPIWLSLGWAYSFVFLREFEGIVFKLERITVRYSEYSKKARNIIILDFITFVIALLFILTLWRDNLLLTVFLSIFLLSYIIRHPNKPTVFLIITAMLSYSTIDLVITHVGLWTYSNINLSTITTWLPVAYGLIAVIVSRISESLSILLLRKKA